MKLSGFAHPIALLVLGILVTASYAPGLSGPFAFDDQINILQRTDIHLEVLDSDSLKRAAFSYGSGLSSRAIALLSLAVTYYAVGLDVVYYKVTNLLIHLLTGFGLYLLTIRLLRRCRSAQENRGNGTAVQWVALGVAAIWLLHPLNLTSVLYVVQRMNSLSAFFTVIGLLVYTIAREWIIAGRRHGISLLVASIGAFTPLAVLSKENGVLLPLLALIIEVSFYRFAANGPARRNFLVAWSILIAGPLLLGVGYVVTHFSQVAGAGPYFHRDFDVWERLMTESRVLWFYLTLIVVPNIKLMGLYHDDFAISRGLLDPITTLPALLGIIALSIAGLAALKRHPLLGFGILWFLCGHVLESTIVPLELVHEHRNYLPAYGPILVLVWHLGRLMAGLPRPPQAGTALFGAIILVLAGATFVRATLWSDPLTLAQKEAENHPNSGRTHTSLGIALRDAGLVDAATESFVRAASLSPTDDTAVIRLAHHLYLTHGSVDDELMKELDRRLQRCSCHPTVLWVYEPLLFDTRKNLSLQKRFIEIFERMVNRPDVVFTPRDLATAYRSLAWAYRVRRDYVLSSRYAERARASHPIADDYLFVAELQVRAGETLKAQENLARYQSLNRSPNKDERERISRVEEKLDPTRTRTMDEKS